MKSMQIRNTAFHDADPARHLAFYQQAKIVLIPTVL
jgi:hypothetical protein